MQLWWNRVERQTGLETDNCSQDAHIAFGIVYNPPKSNGRAMTDHTVSCVDDITQKHPYAGVVILGDSNRLRDASLSSYSLKQIVVGETRGRAVLDKIFTNIADWYKPSVILPEIGQSDHSTVLRVRRPAAAVLDDAGQYVTDAGPTPSVTEARDSDAAT